MGAWLQRRRLNRATKVSCAIADEEVRSECWDGVQLLLQAELTFEGLVVTAAEGFSEHRSQRREDEKVLTAALKERDRVERTWRTVAHTLATRAAAAGNPDGEWALGRLRDCYPLREDVEKKLDAAFQSFEFGRGPVEINLARVAFAQLIGSERTRQMAIFDFRGLSIDFLLLNGSFRTVWELSEERFLAEARSQQRRPR